jgi:hypothetical protein
MSEKPHIDSRTDKHPLYSYQANEGMPSAADQPFGLLAILKMANPLYIVSTNMHKNDPKIAAWLSPANRIPGKSP